MPRPGGPGWAYVEVQLAAAVQSVAAAEFAHVSDTDERLWLQDEFQLGRMQQRFSAEERGCT